MTCARNTSPHTTLGDARAAVVRPEVTAIKSKLSHMHYRCNNVGACTGTSFQDLTTFNLGTFDGPTDLTFSPSAINQFNTSLGNLTDVDIYTA